jgi:hypothetical protein
MYCKCKKCKYPNDHLTKYHHCGTCKQFGHGQIECPTNNGTDYSLPGEYIFENINDPRSISPQRQCTMTTCKHRMTHTTLSHSDMFDKQYESSKTKTELVWLNTKLHESCRGIANVNSFITDYYFHIVRDFVKYGTNGKIYVSSYGGMGNTIFAKRDHINDLIKVKMIYHEDDTNINNFINGYRDIDTVINKEKSKNIPLEPYSMFTNE